MAFTDNFTGAPGQLLSARAGWTYIFGTTELSVNSAGTALGRGSGAISAYFREDDGSTNQTVGMDWLVPASLCGIGVMLTGNSAATLNGYWLRPQVSGTSARLYRIDNGNFTSAQLISVAITDTLQLELRATVVNGNVDLKIFSHGGASPIASATDSSVNKKLSGRRGIVVSATTSIADVDNFYDNFAGGQTLFLLERVSRFFEGVRDTTPDVFFSGTYTTAPASIEARIEVAGQTALSGFDWSVKVASPSGGTFSINYANVPVGGPYTLAIRNSASPGDVIRISNTFFVGAIVILWGQSQNSKLGTDGLGGVTPTAGMRILYSASPSKTTKNAVNVSKEIVSQSATIGSGIIAMANQWHLDTGGALPLLLQDCTVSGTSISTWINDGHDISLDADANNPDPTYTLWTHYATQAMIACSRQASAVMYMQGTSDLGNQATYAASMETLKTKFLGELPGQNPLFTVVPHQRSIDNDQTWNMRNLQYNKAISGGNWRFCCWLLDWEMDSNVSPHQSSNPQGNPRGGTRIGRGLARNLFNTSLDVTGPQIVSVVFTSSARTAVDVTFDRDISAANGTSTTGLPGHFFSVNNSTFPDLSNATGVIISSRVLRLTSTAGAFPYGQTRYDMLRNIPFSADPAVAYVGPESAMEANFLSKVITDTGTFEGGRGMPASPIMNSGKAVALPLAVTANGYATSINVAQA